MQFVYKLNLIRNVEMTVYHRNEGVGRIHGCVALGCDDIGLDILELVLHLNSDDPMLD